MGCGASKEKADTAEAPQPMAEVKKEKSGSKGGVAFEIPADELKVASNPPPNLTNGSKKSLDKLDEDPEVLKERLKAKEEQAEKNRQRELESIQAKSKKRDEQQKAAAERKKKIEEEGGPSQSNDELSQNSNKGSGPVNKASTGALSRTQGSVNSANAKKGKK